MKVRVTLSIDVDPEAWTDTYGIEGAAEIRADVKQYVRGLVSGCAAADEGAIVDVEG